jgi:hypothetical protein
MCVRDPIRRGGSALVALSPNEGRSAGRGLQIVEQFADLASDALQARAHATRPLVSTRGLTNLQLCELKHASSKRQQATRTKTSSSWDDP